MINTGTKTAFRHAVIIASISKKVNISRSWGQRSVEAITGLSLHRPQNCNKHSPEVRVHAGTTQVDFEVDRPPPADSPPGDPLITMLKETVIIIKRFLVFGKQTYTSEAAAIGFKTFRSITHQENTWTTRNKDSTQIYTG